MPGLVNHRGQVFSRLFMAACVILAPPGAAGGELWTSVPKKIERPDPGLTRIEVDPGLQLTFSAPLRWDGTGPIPTLEGTAVSFSRFTLPPRDLLCIGETGGRWACGIRAYLRVNALLSGRTLFCGTAADAGREALSGDCRLAGRSVTEQLVGEGWAVPSDAADAGLAALMEQARAGRRGQWGSGPK